MTASENDIDQRRPQTESPSSSNAKVGYPHRNKYAAYQFWINTGLLVVAIGALIATVISLSNQTDALRKQTEALRVQTEAFDVQRRETHLNTIVRINEVFTDARWRLIYSNKQTKDPAFWQLLRLSETILELIDRGIIVGQSKNMIEQVHILPTLQFASAAVCDGKEGQELAPELAAIEFHRSATFANERKILIECHKQ